MWVLEGTLSTDGEVFRLTRCVAIGVKFDLLKRIQINVMMIVSAEMDWDNVFYDRSGIEAIDGNG